jgi:hypothetical protein
MNYVKDPILLICVFLWIGFVCAISFMEAWLKFKAPGITLRIGLNVGRVVFKALNKMEWVFAVIIAARLFFFNENIFQIINMLYFLSLSFLIFQTFLILPVLDSRAEAYLKWKVPQPSKFHLYYVILEIIKVMSLFIFGLTLFN